MAVKKVTMTVGEALDLMETKADGEFIALGDALLRVLPSEAGRTVRDFNRSWNFNHPYEYYVRELTARMKEITEACLGRRPGFWDRIRGKTMVSYSTVMTVKGVPK